MAMPPPWTHRLADPWPPDRGDEVAELGGKGAGLVRLIRAGFPVPVGFVIRVAACEEFLRTGQWPEGLKAELERELGTLTTPTFAVRSGAAVSMPGILESKIDVSKGEVPAAVEEVFRSWTADRAVAYRRANHLNLPGTAVLVQEMVACDLAGVAFSQDPLGEPGPKIEVVRGSGQSLVSGERTPYNFLSLGDRADELLDLVRRIEDLFQAPVDVEWGLSNDRFVHFQARPIRSLQLRATANRLEVKESQRLLEIAKDRRTVWVAHNLGDTVVHPTPLEWDLWSRFMSGSGGLGTLFRGLGYQPPHGGTLELILGRVYADVQKEIEFPGIGLPMTVDLDAVAADPATITPTVDRIRTGFRTLLKMPAALWRLRRVGRRTAEPPEKTVARFDTAERSFDHWLDGERSRSLSTLTSEDLLAVLESRRRHVFDEFGPEAVRPGFFCGLAMNNYHDPNHPTVRTLLTTRETARAAMGKGLDRIWAVVDELDRRWAAGGGLRFLTLDELPTYPTDRERLEPLIAERRLNRDAARFVRLPPVIDSAKLDGIRFMPVLPPSSPTRLSLSPGITFGPVWNRTDDPPPPGSVVVSETADPEIAKWFGSIVAVVVERGGVLSHLAVLAREAGIPAAVCPEALRMFRNGEVVDVDGTMGLVSRRTPT
jgi:phosphohistidine swiveling domain-containing protein